TEARRGDASRGARRLDPPEPGQHGLPRRENDEQRPQGRARRRAHRHRRAARHEGEHERAGDEGALEPRSQEVARRVKGLVARAIAKSYGPTKALRGVDLEAEAGSVLAVIGQNGAGKSTLM